MPNWCYTQYAVTGEQKSLKDFYNKIVLYTSKPRWDDSPVEPYQFGKNWLGNILTGFGIGNMEGCRGEILSVYLTDEALFFDTETAWCPSPEVISGIISENYSDDSGVPKLYYYYLSEEPGWGLFINTDTEHRFFKTVYLLDDGDNICEYIDADEIDEFCDRFRDEYGLIGNTPEELVAAYNAREPENELWLYHFEEG